MTAMGNGSAIPAAAAGMLLPQELLVTVGVAKVLAPVFESVGVRRAIQLPLGTSTTKNGFCACALLNDERLPAGSRSNGHEYGKAIPEQTLVPWPDRPTLLNVSFRGATGSMVPAIVQSAATTVWIAVLNW